LLNVDRETELSLERLQLYLDRVKRDLLATDRASATAYLAEVRQIASRLWDRLAKLLRLFAHDIRQA
jgi:hypothetical protein